MPKPPPNGPSSYTPNIEISNPKDGAIFSSTDIITVTGLAFLTCENEGGDCIGNVNLSKSRVEVTFGDPTTHLPQPATLGKPDNPPVSGTESSIQWTFTAPPPSDATSQIQITATFHYNEGGKGKLPPVTTQITVNIGAINVASPSVTTYSFYDESVTDWSDPGPHSSPSPNDSPYEHTSLFYSRTEPFAGTNISNQWVGIGKAFTVVRNDTEFPVVLSSDQILNQDWILDTLQNMFTPPASFGNKIFTSYAYGAAIQGPGGDRGGLLTVPQAYRNKLLLTINLPFHINTPPGLAAVDGFIVYYAYISFPNGNPSATVLGVAHPWNFERGLVGAGQDQINSGLDKAVQGTDKEIEGLLNLVLANTADRVRKQTGLTILDGYLLPGIVTQQGTSPAMGDASTDITLALIPGTPL